MNSFINKHLTTRKGFITGVVLLILFNLIFISSYYSIYANKKINEYHTEIRNELKKEIKIIKEKINTEENPDTYLKEYTKKNNINIVITNKDNKIEKEYLSKENKKPLTSIVVSEIVEKDNTYYLISLSKKQDIVASNIIFDFFIFEIITIIVLGTTGILGANFKILEPLSTLSKDLNNYKLGILPKKRKINSGIDTIQNEFVDLVGALEEEKAKQNRIIASISHDIKTPLTSILGYSELLITNEKLSTETKEKYTNKIHDKALVMKEIVEEFDDYLSLNMKDKNKQEKISISALIEYLNNYYKEDLKEKNIDFKIRTNCPNLTILVDLSNFKRVFSNIITNSIRHYNKEKNVLNININEQKNGKIKFEIADNGIGCNDDLEKIFEPLYTSDKSRKISGLGLSICKEIIESHKGTIKAENNKLGGLSIIFNISAYKEK